MSELSDILAARGTNPRGIEHALYKSAIRQRDDQAWCAILNATNSNQYRESVFSDAIGKALVRSNWETGFELWLEKALELVDGNNHAQYLDLVLDVSRLNPAFQSQALKHTHSFFTQVKNSAPRGRLWNVAMRLSQLSVLTNNPDIFDDTFRVFELPFNLKDLWSIHYDILQEDCKVWVMEKWLQNTNNPVYFQSTWCCHVKYGTTDDLRSILECGAKYVKKEDLRSAYEELLVSPIVSAQRFGLCEQFDALAQINNWSGSERYPNLVSRRIAQVATQNIIPPHQWEKWVDNLIACDGLQLVTFFIAAHKEQNWNALLYIHTNHSNYLYQRLEALVIDTDPTWVEDAIGQLGSDVDRILAQCPHSTPILDALKQQIALNDAIGSPLAVKTTKKM